jgi:hypothetical protein
MENKRNGPSRAHAHVLMAAVILLLWGGFLAGCSSQYSHFKLSYSVENQFQRSRLYPGYKYYASGTKDDPLALVALEPDVILESDVWKPVEMTPKQLDSWVQAFRLQPWIEYNQVPNGAVIADPQGKRIGYYYSVWKYPQVRFLAANRIDIEKPVAELRVTNRVTSDDTFGLGWD